MNKVNRIRIFCILLAAAGIAAGSIYRERQENAEEMQEKNQNTEEIRTEEESETATPTGKLLNDKYLVVEEGDYLTVYFADGKTVYEYTDIRYSNLEENLRRKIRRGYTIQDEKELFGFLENYSS